MQILAYEGKETHKQTLNSEASVLLQHLHSSAEEIAEALELGETDIYCKTEWWNERYPIAHVSARLSNFHCIFYSPATLWTRDIPLHVSVQY